MSLPFDRRKTVLLLLSLTLFAGAALALVAAGGGRSARAQVTLGRVGEAIVVEGAELAPFHGAPWDTLWAYAWVDGSWEFLVGQLDERDEEGLFVAGEDGALDANDVYLFMADVLGGPRPEEAWPERLSRDYPAVEIQVHDPLRPEVEAFAYLFRSGAAPYPRVAPRLRYDPETRELASAAYTLGFADPDPEKDGFVGLKRLSLRGAERDLLDRMKIRVEVSFGGFTSIQTENELAVLAGDALTPAPIKVGLLRAILDPTGGGLAYEERATLFGVLQGLGEAAPPLPGVGLGAVRVSLDLAADLGEVSYRDANIPAGVAVDGQPDSVPEAPLPAWREIRVAEGRAVLLRPDAARESSARVYYKDDARQDAEDTGDYRSFGDQGAQAANVQAFLTAGFPGQMVVLRPDEALSAADLAGQLANPLEISVRVGEALPTPSPGPGTPSPEPTSPGAETPTATRQPASPSPSPSSGEPRHLIHLPFATKP